MFCMIKVKCKDLSAQAGPEMCNSFTLTVSEKRPKTKAKIGPCFLYKTEIGIA